MGRPVPKECLLSLPAALQGDRVTGGISPTLQAERCDFPGALWSWLES